jgi:hypothetical protein
MTDKLESIWEGQLGHNQDTIPAFPQRAISNDVYSIQTSHHSIQKKKKK